MCSYRSAFSLIHLFHRLYFAAFNELRGTLPTEVGCLTNLQVLHLGSNSIGGTFPSELGLLTSLTLLNIGMFSSDVFNLSMLAVLSDGLFSILHRTETSGTFPTEIGNLSRLTKLELTNMAGSLPSELGKLTSMEHLDLCKCALVVRIK